jgi:hypothetical protein
MGGVIRVGECGMGSQQKRGQQKATHWRKIRSKAVAEVNGDGQSRLR